MHLNEIKKKFPKAFKAYVEMLIEDCADQFEVVDNVLTVKVQHVDEEEYETTTTHTLAWRPSKTRKTMDVGAGWEPLEPQEEGEGRFVGK